MMHLHQLAPWYQGFPGLLAGSVYAAAPSVRTGMARALAQAGLDVHVDMMAESDGLPAGVSLAQLRDIAAAVRRARLGVHLIGSTEFVDATLRDILPLHPATVFLPWAAFTDERAAAIRAVGSSAWITLWNEWDPTADPQWPAPPDGVLVMLIEPGTRGDCRLDRLSIAATCASEIPVAVDGGITQDVAPLCVAAGVKSMVVGRALLPDHPLTINAPAAQATSKERTT